MEPTKKETPETQTPALKDSHSSPKLTKRQLQSKREFAKQFPLLRGFKIGGSLAVFCNRCNRFHFHGWDAKDDSRTDVLRFSHCSLGNGDSYRIAPICQRELEILERLIKRCTGLKVPLTKLSAYSKDRVEWNKWVKQQLAKRREGK